MNQSEAQAAVAQYGSVAAAARALGRNERSFRRLLNGNKPPKSKTTESAVLHLTDLHYGKETETFNVDVLEKRIDRMIEHALDINSILKSGYKFDKLVIPITGDAIDGSTIYKTHPYHVDKRAAFGRAQAMKLAKMLKPRILTLREIAPKIEIAGVLGNHGRVTKFDHESNNWDGVFLDNLSLMFDDDKNVSVKTSDKNIEVIDIQGHGFLLYHGAGIRMMNQIPFYGIRQRVLKWSRTIKTPFVVVLMGHFHQCIEDAIDEIRILLSGTAVSDDDFSIEFLGVDGARKMNFFGVHPDHPITWQYKIDLDA
jgi:hypothetical protein